jgi:hypothetical protein
MINLFLHFISNTFHFTETKNLLEYKIGQVLFQESLSNCPFDIVNIPSVVKSVLANIILYKSVLNEWQ